MVTDINETFYKDFLLNVIEPIKDNVITFNYYTFFYMFLLPIIIILLIIFLLKFKKQVLKYIEDYKLKNNYIKVWIIGDNKFIKEKTIKLDTYNTFTLGKRKYCLDDIRSYIIGYVKNIPLIMFDKRFIFPLSINEYLLNKEAMRELGITENDLKQDIKGELKYKIKALYLKIDSALLNVVYSKKLISDLYDVSKDNPINATIIWVVVGLVGFAILYYTGIIPQVLSELGVNITK